jgi:hypothetical protein
LAEAQKKLTEAGVALPLHDLPAPIFVYAWAELQRRATLTDMEVQQLKLYKKHYVNAPQTQAAAVEYQLPEQAVPRSPSRAPVPPAGPLEQPDDIIAAAEGASASSEAAGVVALPASDAHAVDADADADAGSDERSAGPSINRAAAPQQSASPGKAARPQKPANRGVKRHAASNDQYLAPPPDDDRAARISRPSGKSTKLAAMAPAVQQVYPRPTYTGRTHRTKDPVVGGEVELALTDNVREHGLEPGHRGRLLTLETRSNTVEVLVDRGAGECVEHHKLHHRDVYHVVP